MESLRLYLVRHGQTDYNKDRIMQGGGIDSELNPTGQDQAQALYQQYKDTPFEAIYSSGLRRTRQTLAPFREAGKHITSYVEFNEMCWGVLEGKQRDEQVDQLMAETLATWAGGHTHHAIRGAESPEQVWERVAPRLDYILDKHASGHVLICTHGRTMRIILCQLLGYGLKHMQLFKHENTAVNILLRSGDRFIPEALNDTKHLEPCASVQ